MLAIDHEARTKGPEDILSSLEDITGLSVFRRGTRALAERVVREENEEFEESEEPVSLDGIKGKALPDDIDPVTFKGGPIIDMQLRTGVVNSIDAGKRPYTMKDGDRSQDF